MWCSGPVRCLVVSIPDQCVLLYFEKQTICINCLRASKDLDKPENTCSLIDVICECVFHGRISLYFYLIIYWWTIR